MFSRHDILNAMSTDVTRADLSDRVAVEIRAWMGRRRVSGAALARALGVSPAWVSYRLSGVQEIGLNDLQRIAAILNVEVSDLLPRENEGRTVVVSGSTPRQTTVSYPPVAEQPRPTGQPKRTVPAASTRRPSRLVHA